MNRDRLLKLLDECEAKKLIGRLTVIFNDGGIRKVIIEKEVK